MLYHVHLRQLSGLTVATLLKGVAVGTSAATLTNVDTEVRAPIRETQTRPLLRKEPTFYTTASSGQAGG